MIDLRSDTVTRPSPGMRAAMAAADVGDDVIDRDPTCERLQAMTAELLGMEDALFMPSGSMSNQIAVRIHCKPGDEFLCDAGCHIYNYEQAAFAQLSGVSARTIESQYGLLRPEQFHGLIRPENDHLVRTRLVCLENTHNRGSGRVMPLDTVRAICDWGRAGGLRTHLDGARLFNAVAATGVPAAEWAKSFDTVSVCFSKGLGAPVGSALAGPRDLIREARRHRKLFGGGMRQAGVLAAACIYGLEHNQERLVDDHVRARAFAEAAAACPGISLTAPSVDSNIVIFEVAPRLGTAAELVEELRRADVLVLAVGPTQIRIVTHLDVDESQVLEAGRRLQQIVERRARQS